MLNWILPIFAAFTASPALAVVVDVPVAQEAAKVEKPKAVAKPQARTGPAARSPIAVRKERLQVPIDELKDRNEALRGGRDPIALQDQELLEGVANSAVLAQTVAAIYRVAGKHGWNQAESFSILPIEKLVNRFAPGDRDLFSSSGLRVAILSLRAGGKHRGLLLTSSFQARRPGELMRLYNDGSVAGLVNEATYQYDQYASDIVTRFSSGDVRESEFVPVAGAAHAWIPGCEVTISGRFCVNARVFDARATKSDVFYEALIGARDMDPVVKEIRSLNLAWPVDRSYISRGYKPPHWGLDMTAPIGTKVHAVADGVIYEAVNFGGWGNMIAIAHELPSGAKFISLYAHLRWDSLFRPPTKEERQRGKKVQPRWRDGMPVKRGDVIGFSANTGQSRGPHLHLEIRKLEDGKNPFVRPSQNPKATKPVDPLRVLNLLNILFDGVELQSTNEPIVRSRNPNTVQSQ